MRSAAGSRWGRGGAGRGRDGGGAGAGRHARQGTRQHTHREQDATHTSQITHRRSGGPALARGCLYGHCSVGRQRIRSPPDSASEALCLFTPMPSTTAFSISACGGGEGGNRSNSTLIRINCGARRSRRLPDAPALPRAASNRHLPCSAPPAPRPKARQPPRPAPAPP